MTGVQTCALPIYDAATTENLGISSSTYVSSCMTGGHRWITGMCRPHEWMWNHVEPVHVVRCTLSRHNTNLAHRCKVVGEMHPSIINVFEAQSWTHTVWRNRLNIPKLPPHLLWLVYDNNGTPSDMSRKAWNEVKLSNYTVVTVRHPTNISYRQLI